MAPFTVTASRTASSTGTKTSTGALSATSVFKRHSRASCDSSQQQKSTLRQFERSPEKEGFCGGNLERSSPASFGFGFDRFSPRIFEAEVARLW